MATAPAPFADSAACIAEISSRYCFALSINAFEKRLFSSSSLSTAISDVPASPAYPAAIISIPGFTALEGVISFVIPNAVIFKIIFFTALVTCVCPPSTDIPAPAHTLSISFIVSRSCASLDSVGNRNVTIIPVGLAPDEARLFIALYTENRASACVSFISSVTD